MKFLVKTFSIVTDASSFALIAEGSMLNRGKCIAIAKLSRNYSRGGRIISQWGVLLPPHAGKSRVRVEIKSTSFQFSRFDLPSLLPPPPSYQFTLFKARASIEKRRKDGEGEERERRGESLIGRKERGRVYRIPKWRPVGVTRSNL